MKTKEEVIKDAYGEYYDICNPNKNGWSVKRKGVGFEQLKTEIELEYDKPNNAYAFRPKSLNGIESNNGWISINSEKDLPTIGTFYTILSFDENIVEREFPHPKFTLEFNKEWWLKYVTHYQEKIMPNKPLHK